MRRVPAVDEFERIRVLLERLRADEEVAIRDIRAALNQAQVQALEDAWVQQQELRKTRVRSKEEQQRLGFKSKREVLIEQLEAAYKVAEENLLPGFERVQRELELRQTRIYFEGLKTAEAAGKTPSQQRAFANNELTRANLRRMDGMYVTHRSKRDREIAEMEAALMRSFREQTSDEEREQARILEDHENALGKRTKER